MWWHPNFTPTRPLERASRARGQAASAPPTQRYGGVQMAPPQGRRHCPPWHAAAAALLSACEPTAILRPNSLPPCDQAYCQLVHAARRPPCCCVAGQYGHSRRQPIKCCSASPAAALRPAGYQSVHAASWPQCYAARPVRPVREQCQQQCQQCQQRQQRRLSGRRPAIR